MPLETRRHSSTLGSGRQFHVGGTWDSAFRLQFGGWSLEPRAFSIAGRYQLLVTHYEVPYLGGFKVICAASYDNPHQDSLPTYNCSLSFC